MKERNMVIYTLRFFLILLIFCSCNQIKKKNNSTNNNIVVPVAPMERIDDNNDLIKEIDSINRIKNHDRNSLLDTINLYNKQFVAEIKLTENTWYIISGRPCENCDANINLYIFPKIPKLLSSENLIKSNDNFSYPGEETDFIDDIITYEANTFYGKCLNEFDEVVVWVQRSLDNQGTG